MGQGKKEANRKAKAPGDGMANVKVKGENFYRYVPSLHQISITRGAVVLEGQLKLMRGSDADPHQTVQLGEEGKAPEAEQ